MNEGREAFRQRLTALREHYQLLLPERIEAVRQACAEVLANDGAETQLAALYHLVHNLAGSGATFGFHEVSESARRFERFIQALITASPGLTETQRDQLHAHRVLFEAASAPAESSRESSVGWSHRLEPSKPQVPAGSEKLIFLVDDDQDLATHLDYALRQFGYTVRLFPELQGLREAVAHTLPLAILMDLAFPEGDLAGAEIIRAINAEREEPIPVIFISVRDDLDARLHAVRAGNTHYLAKPLDIPALVRTLDEVVLARPPEPYRILIVDDDAELAAFYQVHLEQAGMTVSVVTDPREALAALSQTRAELVLMDVHMPFCSGLELAAVIRQCEEYTGLAIVFLSTESNIDRQLAAMHLGGDDFLTKPIEPWHLVRSVQARVKRARDLRLAKERLASQVLRQGEERYRQLVELIPVAVYTCDALGVINYFNEHAAELWGRRPSLGDCQEKFCGSCRLYHPDGSYLPHDQTPIIEALAAGKSFRNHDVTIERPDGSRINVLVNIDPIRDSAGNIAGVINTFTDITERKYMEEALKTADRHKDEFLAMLAHELRNPLAPISNAVAILKLPELEPDQMARCTDMINRQVKHLTRLVDDLLDVSRISRGLVEPKKEPLEIRDFILPAVETCQPLIDTRRHTFSLALPPEPVWIEGDRIRLAQVVSNLLNNAAKYTEEEGHIELSVEDLGRDVRIQVSDNGSGIDPGDLAHLFDLFYQADRNIDRAQGGLGIGLSLVHNLVAKHGGHVQAFSAGRGQGSEFVIWLPRLIHSPYTAPMTAAPLALSANQRRILVVDDNRDVNESLALLLESEGHQVLTAYDGLCALETARIERPDIILMDIGLPGMDGYAVAQALRQNYELERTLLIALTGYGQPDDRKKSSTSGFDEHLVKPVDIEKLRELLASYPATRFHGSLLSTG